MRSIGIAAALLVSVIGKSVLANQIDSSCYTAISDETLELRDEMEIGGQNPKKAYQISIQLRDGWQFEDNQVTRTITSTPGSRKAIRIKRGPESATTIVINDEDRHLVDPDIKAGDVGHAISLYPFEEPGVTNVGGEVEWVVPVNPEHSVKGVIKIDPEALETIVTTTPAPQEGFWKRGRYSAVYSTTWTWDECIEEKCSTAAATNDWVDVYELRIGNAKGSTRESVGNYIGLDLTDEGKKRGGMFKAKASILSGFEGETAYTWKVCEKCKPKGSNNEEIFEYDLKKDPKTEEIDIDAVLKDPTVTLSCHAAISGCHPSCNAEATAVTNLNLVVVDVTIAMADCKKQEVNGVEEAYPWRASEAIEEKQGAFIHYENDHELKPFSPRGTNALARVWFSVLPEDLPETEIIALTFDEEALWEKKRSKSRTTYSPAKKEYTVKEIREKEFYLHGHKRSDSLCDKAIVIEHPKSGAKDKAKYTVVELDLVPDFDRNHKIDDDDEEKVVKSKTFYWWLNDDADDGDCSNHIADEGRELPGKGKNHKDSKVNGRTDLLDFFPLWTKIGFALELCRSEEGKDQKLSIKLRSKGIGYVQSTELESTNAGSFLNKNSRGVARGLKGFAPWFTETGLHEANVGHDKNEELADIYTDKIKDRASKMGILLAEGRDTKAEMFLDLCRDDKVMFSVPFKCDFRNVLEMMEQLDLYGETAKEKPRTITDPDFLPGDATVIYLHGFKVSKEYADGWNADAFKRLYQSGSNAKFVGVAWPGMIDEARYPGLYYHRCAYNAFRTAKKLAAHYKKNYSDKRIIFMAHSLGNMVVASTIQDNEGVNPDCFFILNGAIASEAFDENLYRPDSYDEKHLIEPDWRETAELGSGYPLEAYCSEWYRFFLNDDTPQGKSRAALTWKGRFKDVKDRVGKLINFYSEQDEVFEISTGNAFSQITGFRFVLRDPERFWQNFLSWTDADGARYCWQKQEIGKGVTHLNLMEDSTMAGWGFAPKNKGSEYWAGWFEEARMYTRDSVWDIVEAQDSRILKMKPVFLRNPNYVFMSTEEEVIKEEQDKLLSFAIPAISKAMGISSEYGTRGKDSFPMVDYRTAWGRDDGTYGDRWLHCDLKDMAYFYNWKLWDKFVEEGALK